MKNEKKPYNQLIAKWYTLVLQEGVVIDRCVIYGLGITYKNTKLMKLVMNFKGTPLLS